MKIIWLTNNCPQFLGNVFDIPTTNGQGWLNLLGEKMCSSKNEMIFVFGYKDVFKSYSNDDNVKVYMFPAKYSEKDNSKDLFSFFKKIIIKHHPDVIHIHGTEFYHSYSMFLAAKSVGLGDSVVVSIQGLTHVIEKYYLGLLPKRIIKRYTLGDLIRRKNLIRIQKIYKKRGVSETRLLSQVHNVIGRTDWDKNHSKKLNKLVNYYKCNECLRNEFYHGSWDYDKCEKHSIFLSQSSNPNKGMHHAIEALKELVRDYDDAKLYVTGKSVFDIPWYKIDSYHKYLKDLILSYGLKERVVFLGDLNAEQMKNTFLKANVFILPSAIENSPNSLCEAMMLGVPCVAAYVGGIPSIMDCTEGQLYTYSDPSMLSYCISNIFNNKDCFPMVEKAKKRALQTHDVGLNFNSLMDIYRDICSK